MKKPNPFKKLETEQEVPQEIKEKVMKDIDGLKLMMEFGDLFSFKLGSVFKSFLKSKK